jgi:hypothetical protein
MFKMFHNLPKVPFVPTCHVIVLVESRFFEHY